MEKTNYHKPVLLNEVLEYLDPKPNKIYLDVTFGGGGHTRAILEKETKCKVIALDWDKNAIEKNGVELLENFPDRLSLIWSNFSNILKILKKEKISGVDGILADFGTSQFQINESAGFSVYKDTLLDMRMSPSHQKITAAEIVNKATQKKLEEIFFEFGEERFSRQIARSIVEARNKEKIKTTGQLAKIVKEAVGKNYSKIHPATRIFQALRIYVNNELGNIHSFLSASLQALNPDGRLVCISFHSLEDRLVKQFLKDHSCVDKKGFKILTQKVVTATPEEIKINPSSRSAKLRAGQLCFKE